MEKIIVSTYRGLSLVSGEMNIELLFEFIRGNTFRDRVLRLRDATETGETEKAERMKKQLPFHTITSVYTDERLAYSMAAYQDIITLDCDEMPVEDLPMFRQLTNECPDTLGDFASPRMHGLKIFVYLTGSEAEALRAELNALGTVDLPTLERYHHRMYALACARYEQLLHTKIDTSGSDLGRGFFASYDPEAFLSPERLKKVKPLTVKLALPTKDECKKKKRKKADSLPPFVPAAVDSTPIELQVQLDFRKALEYTKRKEKLMTGNRDNFFYCLGNQCYRRGIQEEEAILLTQNLFPNQPDFDFTTPLRNAYVYTTKTDQKEEKNKESSIAKLIHFMDDNYEFRRNIVKEKIEFRRKASHPSDANPPFDPLRLRDINTFYVNAQLNDVFTTLASIKALVDSDYAKPYNPFIDYFTSLKKWDGETDYIAQLAQTVVAKDQHFFTESLRHWLVAMVACAIDDDVQNHQLMLLHSRQGVGKTSFIRRLLPPELHHYYRNGMINPAKPDHLLQMSSSLIINLDEFDSIPAAQWPDLKRLITQEVVTERKAYDIQTDNYIRRASFIASTNNEKPLKDIRENRRVVLNCILSVDLKATINYEGVYGQAYALYLSGYKYWYDNEEVTALNERNEKFRQKDPVEENLFFYFRPGTGRDLQAQWLPASQLLSVLSLNGRTQANAQQQQILTVVLEINGFTKRVSPKGITEYLVVEYSLEERQAYSILPQMPRQEELGI